MARGRKGANSKPKRALNKPPGLSPAESELWDYTVSAQSPAWSIPGMEPLLVEYVVGAVLLRRLYNLRARELASEDLDLDLERLDRLSDTISKEARKLASVMTKLRLTPQSRTKETQAKTAPRMPWEDFPEDDGDTA
jgi:hypothetical protein